MEGKHEWGNNIANEYPWFSTVSQSGNTGKVGRRKLWKEFCCRAAHSMLPGRGCPCRWQSQRELPSNGHLGTCGVTASPTHSWVSLAKGKGPLHLFLRWQNHSLLWLGKKNVPHLTPQHPLLKTAPHSPWQCVWYRITSPNPAPLIPLPRTVTQENKILKISRSSDVCLQEQTLQMLKPCFKGSGQT